MSISPFVRLPFTDITGGMISHQLLGDCQKEEIRYMDCLEAYGLERGRNKCSHLIDDFKECQTSVIQFKRFVKSIKAANEGYQEVGEVGGPGLVGAMRAERNKQIAEGKLTGDNKYVTPRIDAY